MRSSPIRSHIALAALGAALSLVSLVSVARAQAPWRDDLAHRGTGPWKGRVPITVTATGAGAVPAGRPIQVSLAAAGLTGRAAEGVRVVGPSGFEHLFFVHQGGATGPRRTGPIQPGDVLTFGLDALASDAIALYQLYSDNPTAFEVTEMLGQFDNGGFERGTWADARPEAWVPGGFDADHRGEYLTAGGQNGPRCLHQSNGPGADANAWPQFTQRNLPIVVGADYTITASVEYDNVTVGGSAGWYVHTYRANGSMHVNEVRGFDGSSGGAWQAIPPITFTATAEDVSMAIGTVLHAAEGEAWYDDVAVSVAEPALPAVVSLGAEERQDAPAALGESSWSPTQGGSWPVRIDVRAVSFDSAVSDPPPDKLMTIDLRRANHMVRRLFPGVSAPYRVHVVDPVAGAEVPGVFRVGEDELAVAILPDPGAEHRYFVYLAAESDASGIDWAGFGALVTDPALNLVSNGDFEAAGSPPPGWIPSDNADPGHVAVTEELTGVLGSRSVKLAVSAGANAGWPGWRQLNVPAAPSTTYLYALAMRTDLPTARAYGHFDSPSAPETFISFEASERVGSVGQWAIYSGITSSPGDLTATSLHLTVDAAATTGSLEYDGVLLAPVLHGALASVEAEHDAALSGLQLWSASTLVKVFPDDPAPLSPATDLSAAAAAGEREGLQLALRSSAADTVTATVGTLSDDSGHELPPVELSAVGIVPVDMPSAYYVSPVLAYQRARFAAPPLSDGWAGQWPDPLVPADEATPSTMSLAIGAHETRCLWLRVRVPPTAVPGTYTTTLDVTSSGGTTSLPVSFRVWSFTLPSRPSSTAIFHIMSETFPLPPGGYDQAMRDTYALMADYRVSPGMISPDPVFSYDGNVVTMDASRYLDMASYALDELQMNAAFTPWLFFVQIWAHRPSDLLGVSYLDDPAAWDAIYSSAYEQFLAAVDSRGIKDRYVLYMSDEPFCSDPLYGDQVALDLQHVAGLGFAVDPSVRTYSSTWHMCDNLIGAVKRWGIGQYGDFTPQEMQQRLAAGDRLWFTTDGQQVLDTPYLGTERLLPTYAYAYGVDGYEFWGFSAWSLDPWLHGWHDVNIQSNDGTSYYAVRFPNGDGYLVYPGHAVGRTGVVPSIRLEAVRDGQEDYEYYRLLEACAASNPDAAAEATQLLDTARALVPIPNAGGPRSLSIMPDPGAIESLRAAIGSLIDQKCPSIVLPDGGTGGGGAGAGGGAAGGSAPGGNGAQPGESASDEGCGCRVGAATEPPSAPGSRLGWSAGLVLALGVARRRTRQRVRAFGVVRDA